MGKLGIAVMVIGFVLLGLGIAMPFSSDNQMYCEQFRRKAVDLASQAMAAQGTPEEQSLMEESESESAMADQMCGYANETKQKAMLLGGGGLLLLVVGFVLKRKGKAKAAPPAG